MWSVFFICHIVEPGPQGNLVIDIKGMQPLTHHLLNVTNSSFFTRVSFYIYTECYKMGQWQ